VGEGGGIWVMGKRKGCERRRRRRRRKRAVVLRCRQ
jgi:hypothetical protein